MGDATDPETGSKPAPGDLALLQAFVNTVDLESGHDTIASPDLLSRWLAAHDLLDAHVRLDDADQAAATAIREGLRQLLLANNGVPADPERLRALDAVASRAPVTVRIDENGSTSLTATDAGIGAAFARLLVIAHEATVDGTFQRLKACRNDTCHWAFYDHSRNRSGTWCSMAVCGSRVKSRAYRERRRPEGGEEDR